MALQDLTPQLRTRLSRLERVVGIFVILATLLLFAGLAYYVYSTAQRKGWFRQKLPYFTFVRNGTGLKVGDPIRLMGFTAGWIVEVEPMPPYQDQFGDVFVRFVVLEPYYGYVWEDSVARVEPANFLGDRYIELTKGTNSAPTYTFFSFEDLPIEQARSRTGENFGFSQEIYDEAITNFVARPFSAVTDAALDRLAALGIRTIQVAEKTRETPKPAGIWDEKTAKYTKIDEEKEKKGYWVRVDETPAVTERLQKIANQVESALPNILELTNTLVRVLTNLNSVAEHTSELLQSAKPVVTNFAKISENLSGPKGTLGDWIIPTNVNAQLTMTLASANTNVSLISSNLLMTLDNVANLTSNLNAQVQANGLMLSQIAELVIHADQMVQGLKRHWLLKGSFSGQTNTPPESVIKPRVGTTP
jgi:ABC-type transporter Mla subunit MlaD